VWCAYGTFLARSFSSVEQIGQTDVVSEEEDVGEMDVETVLCEEWQDGVLRAERPADNAICKRGTEGRERRLLCVCRKRVERAPQRLWL
jgi:hypothetical protein